MPATSLIAEVPTWAEHARLSTDWEAAGWAERGQTLRFIAAIDHLQPRPGDVLLDWGCGTGRLSEFLPHGVWYLGYDREFKVVQRAAHTRDDPYRSFHYGEPAPSHQPDLTACIGVWNLRRDGDSYTEIERIWKRYPTVRTMVASVYRGTDPRCRAHDPGELADFAGYLGCDRFVVDAGYLTNDVLLALHR